MYTLNVLLTSKLNNDWTDRPAHSALKSQLNIQSNETPTCNISKNSAVTKILQKYNLIVWDECTMAHQKALEALYETMKDPRTTPVDELNACSTFDRFRFFFVIVRRRFL